MIRIASILVINIGLCLLVPPVRAADPSATQAQTRFFENRIRPLLANRCFSCHGPKKQRSDLRLDSREAFHKGGSSGKMLVLADKPDQGLLLQVVGHAADVPAMPPKEKLSEKEIADLRQWVKMGAPYPAMQAASSRSGEKHWAFQPPRLSAVPAVQNRLWPGSPVDHFILAALEAKGLQPAPAADRYTLLRRVTFDLTGLPPTVEEIQSFVNDRSPDAFSRVVERLLASPAYGERWGRHWLDVARFADSNGLDENVAHGNAWRYRDFVVSAFNRDLPYDQFVRQQLAGDLMPSADPESKREQLVATGFLSLGPKVLAEVDERKMELDIIDEQVDTVGRTFLAMTIGCARCHDHKFDPLTLEDYYGLAGIFLSTKTMESFRKIARWHEHSLATPEQVKHKSEHDSRMSRLKESLKKLDKKSAQATTLQGELAKLEKTALDLPTAMGVSEGAPVEAPLLRRGNHLNPGKLVPRRFPAILAATGPSSLPARQSGRRELAEWLVSRNNPLTARVLVNRVWRWHFGQGLVRSVDNFGLLGEKPSHPELLDWLALRFMDDGWSIKSLHRLILLSNTYQMSSQYDARAATVDPDDRLYWRASVRRLEAEAIRDSILAVSSGLDRGMGGSLLHVKNREYLFDHTSKDNTGYDSPRRSLYLPVIRNNLYDVFSLFDSTDAAVSAGDRATTTVASQALFALNSDLVVKAAGRLAADLLARPGLGDAECCRALYLQAYGREPAAAETARILRGLTSFDEELRSRESDAGKRRLLTWTWLAHTVLAANEFVYLQ